MRTPIPENAPITVAGDALRLFRTPPLCTRPGCNESTKRKLAFSAHLHNAHGWKQGSRIPESVYTAAKNKCAEDYEASMNEEHKVETTDDDAELSIENNWNKGKSTLKRKRPNSASTSDDHPEPPPAKKQALGPNSARRNAVASIEIQPSHPFTHPHAVHERNNLGDPSTSTASSYVETFSGAYHATGHEFTNGSPSTQPINSVQDYHGAIGRVLSPQLPAPPMRGPMHHEMGGYGVLPPGIPGASVATQQAPPCYSSTTGSHWDEHDPSYDSSFTHGVAQTPHGMSSAHMLHEDPPARGMFNPSRSSMPHGVSNSGIHLSTTEHQAEHLSGSPSLDPRLVQSVGTFGDHQILTRSSSEHSNSPHPDPHTAASVNVYQLDQGYIGYSHSQVPRSVPGGGDQEHPYN
ncbi:hypothetical protein RSOLAG22IIIB_02328 [Rhizoctonia solani]|uniref:Uncharacterized protein n=1 Tax=Rhizoctonia solani TaxID=456999 RepID=A0A0K6GE24_9AGAM|nr:hypothetical protein RSOLAG22IIIB_02328 [Rhizoctonia solani]